MTHEWALGVVSFDIVVCSQQLYVFFLFFLFFGLLLDSGIEVLEGEWAKWRGRKKLGRRRGEALQGREKYLL